MEKVIRSMHIPYTEEELKTEIWKKLFIFGNINLGIYLGVFKEAKNLRSSVDRFIAMHGIYKLIEISNRPYIKIRKLESKIFEK